MALVLSKHFLYLQHIWSLLKNSAHDMCSPACIFFLYTYIVKHWRVQKNCRCGGKSSLSPEPCVHKLLVYVLTGLLMYFLQTRGEGILLCNHCSDQNQETNMEACLPSDPHLLLQLARWPHPTVTFVEKGPVGPWVTLCCLLILL